MRSVLGASSEHSLSSSMFQGVPSSSSGIRSSFSEGPQLLVAIFVSVTECAPSEYDAAVRASGRGLLESGREQLECVSGQQELPRHGICASPSGQRDCSYLRERLRLHLGGMRDLRWLRCSAPSSRYFGIADDSASAESCGYIPENYEYSTADGL